MIYATPYNTETLKCTGVSVDSGFETIEQVQAIMPAGKLITSRLFQLEGVAFSDYKFIDELENIA